MNRTAEQVSGLVEFAATRRERRDLRTEGKNRAA